MLPDSERRKSPRLPLEIWIEELHADQVYFRRTANISAGGVYFDRAIPHPVGTLITLKFALPGSSEMLEARASVVAAHDQANCLGMSVKFVSIAGNGQQQLSAFLASAATRG